MQYYVMQFIQGLGLDEVLTELKHLRRARSSSKAMGATLSRRQPAAAGRNISATDVARSLLGGPLAPTLTHPDIAVGGGARPAPSAGESNPAPGGRSYIGSASIKPRLATTARRESPDPLASAGLEAPASTGRGSPDPAANAGRGSSDPTAPGKDPSSGSVPTTEVHLPGQAGQAALSDSGRHYWQSVARMGIQVAGALEYANSQGIVHRDIKPSNLLLDTQGTVWVTDFGLAKATTDGENLTHTGDIVGTLRYMAPERFQGQADARGDIYSLGLTLYELLTFRPAFELSDRQSLICQILADDPPSPRMINAGIPRDLETIVLKAIDREPARRYQTAGMMAEDLKRFLDDKPVRARRVSTGERLWRWCRRNPALAAVTGLAMAGLVAVTVLSILFNIAQSQANQDLQAEKERTENALARANQLARTKAELARKKTELARNLAFEKKRTEEAKKRTETALTRSQELARNLAAEKKRTETALTRSQELARNLAVEKKRTEEAKKRTETALYQTRHLSAKLLLERGQALIEQNSPVLGMLWLARSLESAPPDAVDLQRVARTNLAGLGFGTGRLRTVLSHSFPVNAAVLSPDGKTVLTASQNIAQLWDAASGKSLGKPLAHRGNVAAAAFSPDGKTALTGSWDKTAKLWKVAGGTPVGKPLYHPGAVLAVAFSPDGKTIATGCQDRKARLWATLTCKAISQPLDNYNPVGQVVFSPDGKWVLSGCPGRVVQVWDAAHGKLVGRPLLHPNTAYRAAFSPDSQTVLTSCFDQKARLWDVKSGKLLGRPLEHPDKIGPVAFRPDGKVVLTGSQMGRAQLWDIGAGRPGKALGRVMRHPTLTASVAFSPDGQTVLTSSSDGTARLWDADTGEPVGYALAHPAAVKSAQFSPDGRSILTICADKQVRLWQQPTSRLVQAPLAHLDPVRVVAFSPDGKKIVTGGGDHLVNKRGEAQLWDTATGRPVGPPLLHKNMVYAVAFSPDGKLVLTGSVDGSARLWEAASGKPVGQPLKHLGSVWAVAFSPDGQTVATGSADKTARLWDVATSQQIGRPLLHGAGVLCVVFSPDGTTVATAGQSHAARLWDATTGMPKGQPLQHALNVPRLAFSPDGRTVLTASLDKTARLWDAQTGKPMGEPFQHQGAVSWVAFSRDGEFLLTAGERTVRVWDARTNTTVRRTLVGQPMQHTELIRAAVFSPDSQQVLTSAGDRSARVWDTRTGQPLGLPLQHRGTIWAVAFSPNGKLLLTGSDDKTACLYSAPAPLAGTPARLVRWAHVTCGQELTREDTVRLLDGPAWQKQRQDLEQLGGPPKQTDWAAVSHGQSFGWHQRLAAEAAAKGRWFAARWHLDRVLAAQPTDWFAHAQRSKAHLQLGHKDRAAADCVLALRLGPRDTVRDWFGRQSPDHETDTSWPIAVWYLDQLLKVQPKDGLAHALRAKAYVELRQPKKAAADYAQAFELGPRQDVLDRFRSYMTECDTREQWDKELWYGERLVQAEPGEWVLWTMRGKAHVRLGQFRQAAAAYARATQLNAFQIGAWEADATLCLYLGDPDAYRKVCAKALRTLKNPNGAAQNMVAWMCVLGPLGRGSVADPKQVVPLAEKALASNRQSPNYLHTLGAALYRAGRFDESLRRLNESMKAYGADGRVFDWLFLAMIYSQRGEPGQARRWLDKAVQWLDESTPTQPKDAGLGLPIPWNHWMQVQLLRFEAEALIRGSAPVAKRGMLVGRARAHVRLQQGDWAARASADFTSALDLEPGDMHVRAERARCWMQLKQWDKAIADLSKAIELSGAGPEGAADARLWVERGRCYRELKQTGKATQDFAQAADRLARELPVRRAIFDGDPEFLLKREALAGFYQQLAEAQRLGDKPAAAIETLERLAKLWPGHPSRLYETAKQMGLVIPQVGKDKNNLTDKEQAQCRQLADQAMVVLGQAVLAGYQESDALRKDADLEPLRTRKDFQALVGALERDYDFPAPTGEMDRWSSHQANSFVWRVVVSDDGRRAISAGSDKTACLWDVSGGKLLRRMEGFRQPVYGVALSRDGRRALIASGEETIRVWDLETGKVSRHLAGHRGWVGVVAFLPDGRRALSGGSDSILRLWDVETGKELHRFTGHTSSIWALAISTDGKRALTGSYDRTLRLWDVKAGKEVRRLTGHQGKVYGAAISPDDRQGLSCGEDGFVRLWDLDSGRLIRRFEGHWANIREVAFSPGGGRILSAGNNRKLILWDTATGQVLHQFAAPNDPMSVRFLPDGRRALSAGHGGLIHLWSLSEEAGRARDLAKKGQPDAATAEYTLAIKHRPKDPWLRLERGQFHARQEQWAKAAADLTAAVAGKPDAPLVLSVAADFFHRRGDWLARRGNPKEAEPHWHKARDFYEMLLAAAPDRAVHAGHFADFLVASGNHWTVLEPTKMTSAGGATLTRQPDGSILSGGKDLATDSYTIEAVTNLRHITGLRLEALPDPSLPGRGPGRTGNFILTNLRVRVGPNSQDAKTVAVVLKNPFATYSQDSWHVRGAIDGDEGNTGWAIWPQLGKSHTAYFEMAGAASGPRGTKLTVLLDCKNLTYQKHILGRFRLSVTTQPLAFTIPGGPDTTGWTRLAAVYCHREEWPKALAALAKATALPGGGTAPDHFLLALVHAQLGRHDRARKALDQGLAALDKNGANDALRQMAVPALTAVMKKKAGDVNLVTRRAHLLARLGNKEQARADYQKAAALEPRNGKWPVRLAQVQPDKLASWNFDHDTDGWQAGSMCKFTKTPDGLWVESTGHDPHLTTHVSAPAGWKELTIRARITDGLIAQVYWGKKSPANLLPYTEIRTQWFAMPSSGKGWTDYHVYFHAEEPFDGLRFDPGAAGSKLAIDSITLRKIEGKKPDDLIRQTTKVIELWPKDLYVRFARGGLYLRLGQPDRAEADFAAALKLDAKQTLERHRYFADEYERAQIWLPAIGHLHPLIDAAKGKPAKAALLLRRGSLLARTAQWKVAAADYAHALELDPRDSWNWYCSAILRLHNGDHQGYRKDCKQMLERFGTSLDPLLSERTAKACLLVSDPVRAPKLLLPLVDRAVAGTEKHWAHSWFLLAKGMAEYRAGHYQSAIGWLRKSHEAVPKTDAALARKAMADLFCAMAYAQGEPADLDKARQVYQQGVEGMDRLVPKENRNNIADWPNWTQFQVVRQEAVELMKNKGKTEKPDKGSK
jgi:WD40 repeat protein/Flp pilus assembly protein TadD